MGPIMLFRPILLAIALLLLAACRAYAGDLPDHRLTPGVARTHLSLHQICTTKWGKDRRHVTAAMKRQVFSAYGYSGNKDPRCVADTHGRRCEIDHLISRELGGADDVANLWPQAYGSTPWNAVMKDRLENRLHVLVCAGTINLGAAQSALASDWTAAYRRYIGAGR